MSDYVASLLIALVGTVIATVFRNEYAVRLAKSARDDAGEAKGEAVATRRRARRAIKCTSQAAHDALAAHREHAARKQGESDAKLSVALQTLDELRTQIAAKPDPDRDPEGQ